MLFYLMAVEVKILHQMYPCLLVGKKGKAKCLSRTGCETLLFFNLGNRLGG